MSIDSEKSPAATDDPRSLGTLIKEIRDETTTLFRQEVALAKTEINEKVSRVLRNAAILTAGVLIAFAGLIVLLIAAGQGVSALLIVAGMEANALWLGPLIVGIIVAAIGGGLVMKGKKSIQNESVVPEKTTQSLKENQQWLKHKAVS
jgi:uncharacterized membrane protein YqjE